MSNLERGFVRLPPDSTGKKSGAAARLIIEYQGESSPNLFEVGDTVVGQSSSASATVVGKNTEGFTAGEGQLYIELESVTSGPFTVGETLLVSAVSYATIKLTASLDEIYYQKDVIVDRDYPDRYMRVSQNGGAQVEFKDGPPSLSTFGGLIVDEPRNVRTYIHAYDALDGQFYNELAGSGSVTYVSDERAVTIDTGGTASGDLARRTSHFYHPYQAGTMTRVIQSVVVGDQGKSNVRRRWGLYDNNDGVYWEVDNSTLYACIRSSCSGSPVETRVAQSNWNRDHLDGSTRFNLDISKANLYFIDFQWLGVGLVRFGVYEEDGTKTIAHVFENPNSNVLPYMRQGTLPLSYEVENTGTAASSSELKFICGAVQNIGSILRQSLSYTAKNSAMVSLTSASGVVPVLSARNALTFNGLNNHSTSIIEKVTLYNNGDAPVMVSLDFGSVLVGASWQFASSGNSVVEYDEAATGVVFQGPSRWSTIVGPGQTINEKLTDDKEIYQDDLGLLVFADNTTNPAVVVTAEVIGGGSGNILSSLTWKEIRQ